MSMRSSLILTLFDSSFFIIFLSASHIMRHVKISQYDCEFISNIVEFSFIHF